MTILFATLVLLLTATSSSVAQSDIRRVDFKNFTYNATCLSEISHKVTVKNGEFSSEKQEDGYVDRFYFNVFDVAYGDLTGDGKNEAVVLTVCNTGGTGNFSEGFIYTIKANRPVLAAHISGGDRADGGLRTARVANGILIIDANYMGDEGGSCCPQFAEITKYKLSGSKLIQTGRPIRRSLFPSERVKFDRGKSGTTVRVRIPAEEGKRYVLGARMGQVLTVSVNNDNASLRLLENDGDVTHGVNNFVAQLTKTGDYTIEIQNNAETEIEVTLNIKIK